MDQKSHRGLPRCQRHLQHYVTRFLVVGFCTKFLTVNNVTPGQRIDDQDGKGFQQSPCIFFIVPMHGSDVVSRKGGVGRGHDSVQNGSIARCGLGDPDLRVGPFQGETLLYAQPWPGLHHRPFLLRRQGVHHLDGGVLAARRRRGCFAFAVPPHVGARRARCGGSHRFYSVWILVVLFPRTETL